MNQVGDARSGTPGGSIRLNDFGGGRVSVPQVKAPAFLQMHQAQKCQNVDISSRSIKKMRGFIRQTASAGTGDVSSIWFDVDTNQVYVAQGTTIGVLNANHTAVTTIGTGLTNNSIWSFCRANGFTIMANGSDAVRTWNGTTFTTLTTPPVTWTATNRPSFVTSWMGRVFAAGCAEDKDILYYSKLFDPNTWTAGTAANSGGSIRIGSDGNPIKAIWPLANGLLIFKDPGLYYLTGGTTFNTSTNVSEFDQTKYDWSLISPSVGCVGHRALVSVEQTLYCWGRDNVFRIEMAFGSAQVQITNIGDLIIPELLAASALQNQFCAVHYPDRKQIWFSATNSATSTKTDVVHCYSYATSGSGKLDEPDGWMLRTGYQHKCMANVRDPQGRIQIYSGGYDTDGYVFLQNSGVNWHDTAMECVYWTAWPELGQASRGRSTYATLFFGPQTSANIQYTYAYDFAEDYYDSYELLNASSPNAWNSSGGSTWGDTFGAGTTGTWNTGTTFQDTIRLFGKGRRIQHRFYSNLLNADFDILEIVHSVTTVGFA